MPWSEVADNADDFCEIGSMRFENGECLHFTPTLELYFEAQPNPWSGVSESADNWSEV